MSLSILKDLVKITGRFNVHTKSNIKLDKHGKITTIYGCFFVDVAIHHFLCTLGYSLEINRDVESRSKQ